MPNRSVLSEQKEQTLRDEPGPGSYNIEAPKPARKSGAFVCKSERFPMPGGDVPGPGHYTISSLVSEGWGAVVDKSTRFCGVLADNPGPAEYSAPEARVGAHGVIAWHHSGQDTIRVSPSSGGEGMLSEMAGPVTV